MEAFLKKKPTTVDEPTTSSSSAELTSLRAKVASLESELAAVTAERDALRAAAKAAPAPTVKTETAAPTTAAAAPAPAAAAAAAAGPTDVGKVLHETPTDVAFLTPRGRFKLRFCENALVLVGKSTEVVIPSSSISRAFLLPENSSVGGTLLIVSLDAPAQNGKSTVQHLTLHSKPADPVLKASFSDEEAFAGRGANLLRDCLAALVQRASPDGAKILRVSELGTFKPVSGSALACYNKAAEASCYLLDTELLVREGGKVSLFPYKGLRAEVLPPSGRRTFDMQLECPPPAAPPGAAEGAAAAAPPAKALKMELSMIAAEECAGVGAYLKKKKVNVNGCRDKEVEEEGGDGEEAGVEGGAAEAKGGKAKAGDDDDESDEEDEEEDDEDEDEDDSDDEEDDDFAPSEGSEPEEEFDENGGEEVEMDEADEEGGGKARDEDEDEDDEDEDEEDGEEEEEGQGEEAAEDGGAEASAAEPAAKRAKTEIEPENLPMQAP